MVHYRGDGSPGGKGGHCDPFLTPDANALDNEYSALGRVHRSFPYMDAFPEDLACYTYGERSHTSRSFPAPERTRTERE